ncbi:MAG: ComEC/Rec2 family competence protein [Oscillospiraceae bacterium]|nr:ComEC/Rec2 family competence protein [Oscillospiraceae bacterium]
MLYLLLLAIVLAVKIDYPARLSRRTDLTALAKRNWVILDASIKSGAYGQRSLMVAQSEAGIKILLEGEAELNLQPGTVLKIAANLQPLTASAVYQPAAYWSDGIFYYARLSHQRQLSLQPVRLSFPLFWLLQRIAKLRQWLTQAYISLLGSQNGNLAAAMLIGWDQDLSTSSKETFRLAGLSHLLVVSGANVTLLLQLLTPRQRFWPQHSRRVIVLQMLLLVFYGYVCEFDPSVSRAVATQLLSLTAMLLRRPYNSADLTAKSALIILLLQPSLAWSWGFRMSLSISVLLTLAEKSHHMGGRWGPAPGSWSEKVMWRCNLPWGSYPYVNLVAEMLKAQLLATVAVLPFEMAFASEVSALSGLLNLLAVPLAGLLSVYLFVLAPWAGLAAAVLPLRRLMQRSLGAGLSLLRWLAAQASHYPELTISYSGQLQTAAFAGLSLLVAAACLDILRRKPAALSRQLMC